MDYTSIPRSLFYKEKTDLDVFTRNRSTDSLEHQYFKKLKQIPYLKNSVDAPKYVREILNNACYICGMIYFEEQPSLYFASYLNKATTKCEGMYTARFIQLSTMALVYNWLNTEWFRKEKDILDGGAEVVDEIKQDIYQRFDDTSPLADKWVRETFLGLVLNTDLFHPYIDLDDISCRPLEEVVQDPSVSIEDIIEGIDYICYVYKGLDIEATVLLTTLNRLENEIKNDEENSVLIEVAIDKVKNKLRELGHLPKKEVFGKEQFIKELTTEIDKRDIELEKLCNERDEWKQKYKETIEKSEEEKEPEQAFNSKTGKPCFTSKQMGLLMYAVGCLTESPTPAKSTIGEVVERISGYSETTVNQNMKGSFRAADKEAVAKAIESKYPKLAAKVRKL